MNQNSTTVDLRKYGLETGNTQIKSVGPMVFSPQGILFIGDNVSASIFAIDVSDTESSNEKHTINLQNIDVPLASYLGGAINPICWSETLPFTQHPKTYI